ncbi:hypothetical protein Dimus_015895, partial [Dionaea muscipula]
VFEAFEVPLDDKEGEEPVKTDFYDETFLNICQLRREDGIWWLGSGANRRRDGIEEEAEQVEEDTEVQGEPKETEVVIDESGSRDKFFDVVDEENTVNEGVTAQPVQHKLKSTRRGVDPSGSLPDYDLLHLQANFDRALKVNARFQKLLQKVNPHPLILQEKSPRVITKVLNRIRSGNSGWKRIQSARGRGVLEGG